MAKKEFKENMNLSVGIVGLPNVGKSTLFNALLKKQQAFVANYPFATIEPNVGVVPVPDERLTKLAEITKEESSQLRSNNTLPPIKPATVEFLDIAGLVKGANEGAGLGNKFLSHIREVSVICHVVRVFTEDNIIREGSSDPENDYAVIQTELMLADLNTVQNHESRIKNHGKNQTIAKETFEKLDDALNNGIPARDVQLADEEKEEMKQLFLLTAKPEIVVLNVSEDEYSLLNIETLTERYANLLQLPKNKFVVICAKIESELAELSEEEQKQYLKDLGFVHSGLERLIQKAYETLGLISFLTAPASADASARQGGKWEVRAWTIQKGTKAVDAAGVIHTDFSKAFIKAEVVSYQDFVQSGGWKNAREAGRTRFEGKDYIMQDGDVVEFKIGN